MKIIDNIPVWGPPQENAVEQMKNCLKTAERAALMADHHLGYAVPVGGVVVYDGQVSPSGVGFDIACGNKAVCTDMRYDEFDVSKAMDDIAERISFGVGQKNNKRIDHKYSELFQDEAWDIPAVAPLKRMAREQLGTVGSGNHYVDIFADREGYVWIGVHFGSRGLGHKIASFYIKEGGGKDGINVDPVVLDVDSELGQEYIAAMKLAGRYAYAGRDWVCEEVARLLECHIHRQVHNHHNFAWEENGKWVVRKGATPAFPGQLGFVGGTMGENSVILKGKEHPECELSAYSTVHGAGRVLSRSQAAGKVRWKKGKKTRISQGLISEDMMKEWVEKKAGVVLRGAGVDESPHCYKRLDEVLREHDNTVEVVEILTPLGVAMAGSDEFDPYKD